jgi:carbonic anhydrase/acetyltransferase-like protein (isoleucine patch superfamily)
LEQFGSFLAIVIALLGAFAAAVWVAAIFWAFNDVRGRTLDIYVRLFATLLVAVLGPAGVVLYLILRPPETLDSVYVRALNEEAILRELEAGAPRPGPTAETGAKSGPVIVPFRGHIPQIDPEAWVAPGAVIVGQVTLDRGVTVWYNAVIRADHEPISVGAGSNIQDGAVLHIEHGLPVVIGRDVTVGHGAIVHSATVEDGALIGMGSTVLDGSRIGERSVVGANALVTQNTTCPPASLLLGVPAKIVGQVRPDQVEYMRRNAAEYSRLGAENLASGD